MFIQWNRNAQRIAYLRNGIRVGGIVSGFLLLVVKFSEIHS